MKYIASFSGGKDSMAMILLILEKKLQLDEIVFIDTGLELGETYNFIKVFERKIGFPITRIKSKKTFEEYFYTKKKKGKNKGQIYGWPYTAGFNSWCNDRLKIKVFNKYLKTIKEEYIVYLGIAADELSRLKKLQPNRRALLAELGMTEKDCLEYINKKGFRNPLYWKFERLGCYLCPKQNNNALRSLRRHYPYLWEKMLRMDKDSPIPFRADGTTLIELERKFKYQDMNTRKNYYMDLVEPRLFYKNKQISMFD